MQSNESLHSILDASNSSNDLAFVPEYYETTEITFPLRMYSQMKEDTKYSIDIGAITEFEDEKALFKKGRFIDRPPRHPIVELKKCDRKKDIKALENKIKAAIEQENKIRNEKEILDKKNEMNSKENQMFRKKSEMISNELEIMRKENETIRKENETLTKKMEILAGEGEVVLQELRLVKTELEIVQAERNVLIGEGTVQKMELAKQNKSIKELENRITIGRLQAERLEQALGSFGILVRSRKEGLLDLFL